MKPVIVMTVYRRYHELNIALGRIEELRAQFSTFPDVVLVWAQPEVGRLWFIQELLDGGKIRHVLTRSRLDGEGEVGGTTYPESHNLRLGLEWVRANYDPAETYAIGHAADVWVKGDAYRQIDSHMNSGKRAVVFWYDNAIILDGIWHTNLFGVCLDEQYWPPVSPKTSNEILERQWGLMLQRRSPPGIQKFSNYNQKLFRHNHLSEGLPSWPVIPQASAGGVSLGVVGYLPWWCIFQKTKERFRQWRKSASSLIPFRKRWS